MTEAVLNRLIKQLDYPDWTGKSHSDETKRKMSLTRHRMMDEGLKIVGSYKGHYRCNHPEKYRGDPTGIIYRSGIELRVMQHLDSNPGVISWQSEEFCIPYFDPSTNRQRRYFPDFLVVTKTSTGTLTQIIEVKPAHQCVPPKVPAKRTKRFINEALTFGTNSAKFAAAEEYCRDRGWKFKIITDKDIQSW
jgi:hypothetical protein